MLSFLNCTSQLMCREKRQEYPSLKLRKTPLQPLVDHHHCQEETQIRTPIDHSNVDATGGRSSQEDLRPPPPPLRCNSCLLQGWVIGAVKGTPATVTSSVEPFRTRVRAQTPGPQQIGSSSSEEFPTDHRSRS